MFSLKYVSRTFRFSSNLQIVVVENGRRLVYKGGGSMFFSRSYSSWSAFEKKMNLPEITRSSIKMNNNEDKAFKFTDYDCIGFDLDNTICRYNVSKMVEIEYEGLAKFLINERGYSPKYLSKPIEENLDFMLKGLILDIKKGNILRLSHDSVIMHGSHGTQELTKEELQQYYGPELQWHLTDKFAEDPLDTWNGPHSKNIRTLLDYFDMPAGLVFARAVDTLDEKNEGRQEEYNIYPDILDALQFMFQKEHFQEEKGGYFPKIKSDPDSFIHKCSPKVLNWMKSMKQQNKILFLITGSNVDFASHTATNSMGSDWRELFDIVVCYAKKPGFFVENRPFYGLEGFMETKIIPNDDLKRGGIYTCGNWKGIYKFLQNVTTKDNPNVIYIGDNLIQDVYTPSKHTECDAVAVCEELDAEGFLDRSHFDKELLTSNRWGSYFSQGSKDTIWKDIIKKHAKLCIPNLDFIAEFPVDHNFGTNN